jgi:hypothetical protein
VLRKLSDCFCEPLFDTLDWWTTQRINLCKLYLYFIICTYVFFNCVTCDICKQIKCWLCRMACIWSRSPTPCVFEFRSFWPYIQCMWDSCCASCPIVFVNHCLTLWTDERHKKDGIVSMTKNKSMQTIFIFHYMYLCFFNCVTCDICKQIKCWLCRMACIWSRSPILSFCPFFGSFFYLSFIDLPLCIYIFYFIFIICVTKDVASMSRSPTPCVFERNNEICSLLINVCVYFVVTLLVSNVEPITSPPNTLNR